MVFAKKNDDNLASLAKKLDAALAGNKDLRAVIHLLGEDRDELMDTAKKFKTENIPVSVPVENETGPANWGINPEADLTVFTYRGKKIHSSHGYKEVGAEDIAKIMKSVAEVAK